MHRAVELVLCRQNSMTSDFGDFSNCSLLVLFQDGLSFEKWKLGCWGSKLMASIKKINEFWRAKSNSTALCNETIWIF
jgi:hypothetical protein